MSVLTHGRRRGRRHGEPTNEAGPLTTVDLGPGVEWLQPSLQACLGTGFSVTPGLGEHPGGLVVLAGDDPAGVVEFACAHPEAWVVAVTGPYGADPDPITSAAVIEGGAQDCQPLDSVPVLAAHLRAVARRGVLGHPPRPTERPDTAPPTPQDR